MATIDLASINYIDEPDRTYRDGLDKVRLPADLTDLVERFAALFPDAYEQGKYLSDEDFLQFKAGLRHERKGEFAGEDFMEKFGAILMPANMIHVGIVANQFKVPFGLAFCRMKESGMLTIDGGVCQVVGKPKRRKS